MSLRVAWRGGGAEEHDEKEYDVALPGGLAGETWESLSARVAAAVGLGEGAAHFVSLSADGGRRIITVPDGAVELMQTGAAFESPATWAASEYARTADDGSGRKKLWARRHASVPGSAEPAAAPRSLVLFGDSITQMSFGEGGFGARLSDVFARRLDVINRGFSGYNTRWARHYFDSVFGAGARHALVIIFFGANDASLQAHNERQHVPLAEFGANLAWMCRELRVRGVCERLVLVTPPPVDHDQRLIFQKARYGDAATGVLERTNESAGMYAAECARVAGELDVPCCNLWKIMQGGEEADGNWSRFLSDGLHFTPEGNRFVGARLLETINTAFPGVAVRPCQATGSYANSGSSCDLIPELLPWHDNIDHTSYPPYPVP